MDSQNVDVKLLSFGPKKFMIESLKKIGFDKHFDDENIISSLNYEEFKESINKQRFKDIQANDTLMIT